MVHTLFVSVQEACIALCEQLGADGQESQGHDFGLHALG